MQGPGRGEGERLAEALGAELLQGFVLAALTKLLFASCMCHRHRVHCHHILTCTQNLPTVVHNLCALYETSMPSVDNFCKQAAMSHVAAAKVLCTQLLEPRFTSLLPVNNHARSRTVANPSCCWSVACQCPSSAQHCSSATDQVPFQI